MTSEMILSPPCFMLPIVLGLNCWGKEKDFFDAVFSRGVINTGAMLQSQAPGFLSWLLFLAV